MINLSNTQNRNLEIIAKEYFEIVKDWLKEKDSINCIKKMKKKSKSHGSLYDLFISNLEFIILLPIHKKRHSYNNIIIKNISTFNPHLKEKYIRTCFNNLYETFINDKGYDILDLLKIRVCPYCNRNYTIHVKSENNKVKTRPQFDHYYPKSKYPWLAISFYNLVPSCPSCNLLKRDHEIGVHPYNDSINAAFIYVPEQSNRFTVKEIDIKEPNAHEAININKFLLKDLYNHHLDYVQEILDKSQAYNDSFKDGLITSFQGVGTIENIDNFVWGGYLEISQHENRPLSKLTSDILNQINGKH